MQIGRWGQAIRGEVMQLDTIPMREGNNLGAVGQPRRIDECA